MTLKEAIESGKQFKRSSWEIWIEDEHRYIQVFDALADDWEVEPKPKKKVKLEAYLRSLPSGAYPGSLTFCVEEPDDLCTYTRLPQFDVEVEE